ncbi:unnamed protein product [Mycena citricolor]|uniref:Uncharacterized protein n=1 Tax=Mycena citricolor TaxID=2018698 RepID=A0AAD2HFG5_9AGAR|nr:unnamed protein product [Mycena citricolor]
MLTSYQLCRFDRLRSTLGVFEGVCIRIGIWLYAGAHPALQNSIPATFGHSPLCLTLVPCLAHVHKI